MSSDALHTQRNASTSAALSQAIDKLYEAAVHPEQWRGAFQSLSESINALGCFFVPRQNVETLLKLPISPAVEELASVYINQGWYKHDLRAIRGWPLFESGREVILEQDIGTPEERQRHEYYQEFCRPMNVLWWAALKVDAIDKRWCVAIHRTPAQEPFGPNEVEVLKSVAPHFARAVTLAEQLALASAGGSIDILDRFSLACFLLDWRGRVARVNTAAQRLLGEGLAVAQGKLIAAHRPSNAALQRVIGAAIQSGPVSLLPNFASMRIVRESRPPLFLDAIPLFGTASDVFHSMRAILVARSPGEERKHAAADVAVRLRAIFGLTDAEARLATAIGSGSPVTEAAEKLGITYETARSRLKVVFSKTGVHRQAQLVSLLAALTSPAG